MDVCVIGAGYVGLTTAVILSDLGHNVCCVDINETRIKELSESRVPFHESGLSALMNRNVEVGRLSFSTNTEKKIDENDVIFIAVGTPPEKSGRPNLEAFDGVVQSLAGSIRSYKMILIKSTVPPGTNKNLEAALLQHGVDPDKFDVVSNPEFLREGTAVEDALHPNKIVVGTTSTGVVDSIHTLYKGIHAPYIVTTPEGAEMIKYASNAFLATKISFINEMSRICDAYNVDIEDIARGLGTDPRIGPHFLNAGLGYGGSCFPKDLKALEYSALQRNVVPTMLHAAKAVNDSQIDFYIKKLERKLGELKEKQVTVWGLAFKPDTDDIRLSPAHAFIERLQEKRCIVHSYDPMAVPSDADGMRFSDRYEALQGSDALVIATDWKEFQESNWPKVRERLKGNVIFDGRNCLDPETIRSH
ncbi:MAG TPA: UDP-glucose/GDP-mannose dehydrogenase family protein, partial [Bacillales bacterium]|nr:UDP-glucose/GDP-mannose dehydrogenase family protein [Bacillales bacterium]